MKAMNVGLLTLLAATSLFAADEQQLALTIKAQTDYDRVVLTPSPQLHDTNVCIQSQASTIPVAPPEELPLFHFRKGYCTLAAATLTNDRAMFQQAASEFDQAIAGWPARNAFFSKKRGPEPMPSVFPVLASIARLKAGKGDGKEIESAVAAHSCPTSVMPVARCEALLQTGREWLGWIDLRNDNFGGAMRDLPPASTAWTSWLAGKRAFRDGKYADAATAYRQAVEAWRAQAANSPSPLLQRLGPPVDLSVAYTELGGAQLLAGDTAGALATLNQAVRQDPANDRALYLRGRAKDAAGQTEAAIADYNLAARSALAKANDQASGEAHVYRGVSLYRRKEYAQAEDEFTNALNFEISPALRADAIAWRRLAAVASGSCEVGRRYLEEALPAVSPYFPRDDARTVMTACAATSTAAHSLR